MIKTGKTEKPALQLEVPPLPEPDQFARELLAWYDADHRQLPFRQDHNPYKIWISEIMAQQTRMEALLPYYERFIRLYPDLKSLAATDEDSLMKVWQGLGYYSRARKLLECARLVMDEYGGSLPQTYSELVRLPGIGPYTAGAIASIAFNQRVPAVDGNVIRVYARMADFQESVSPPKIQKQIRQRMQEAMPVRAGDYNQALMELGALICTPKNPKCLLCPVNAFCRGYQEGNPQALPRKDARKARTIENKHIYIWACPELHAIHMTRRPESGLLAGLYGFDERPLQRKDLQNLQDFQGLSTDHRAADEDFDPSASGSGGFDGYRIREVELEPYRHVFTHREWWMNATLQIIERQKTLSEKPKPNAGNENKVQMLQGNLFELEMLLEHTGMQKLEKAGEKALDGSDKNRSKILRNLNDNPQSSQNQQVQFQYEQNDQKSSDFSVKTGDFTEQTIKTNTEVEYMDTVVKEDNPSLTSERPQWIDLEQAERLAVPSAFMPFFNQVLNLLASDSNQNDSAI